MRLISVALTAPQILDLSKDVTRRLGWLHAKPGQLLQPVRKCMGLRPGEKVEKIGRPIRIVSVRRERLDLMITDFGYGVLECIREGFPHFAAAEFVDFFCMSHKGCMPSTEITRIEFAYTEIKP